MTEIKKLFKNPAFIALIALVAVGSVRGQELAGAGSGPAAIFANGIASFVAVCRLGLFLAPAVLILAHLFGVPGVQAAQSVSDIISFIVTVPLQARILRSLGKPRTTV